MILDLSEGQFDYLFVMCLMAGSSEAIILSFAWHLYCANVVLISTCGTLDRLLDGAEDGQIVHLSKLTTHRFFENILFVRHVDRTGEAIFLTEN